LARRAKQGNLAAKASSKHRGWSGLFPEAFRRRCLKPCSWKTALALIVIFSFALRLLALSSVPPGFYCDEASNGYNAYSILLTGKDEHGTFMPLYFKAFGEYKNPVFIYSAVPFVAGFGPGVFSVRLVSAFYGTLTVLALFFLAKKLFGEKAGFAAALLLAISPWHIVFSRIAFEAITMPFYFVAGFYFLLRAREDFKFGLLSALCFSLAVYSYGIAYVFVPFFLAGFFAVYFHAVKKQRRNYALFLLAFLLLATPLLFGYFASSEQINMQRARGVMLSIFSDGFAERYAEEHSLGYAPSLLEIYARNYTVYYSPDFLFSKGDTDSRFSLPGKGMLYWFMLPLVLAGIALCLKERKRQHIILLFWLAAFPVAAASSAFQPHALRALTAIPVFEITAAVAVAFLWGKRKTAKQPAAAGAFSLALLILLAAGVFEFSMFESSYSTDYAEQSWPGFQDGYEEAFAYAEEVKDSYNRIYFSPSLSAWYGQPQTLMAFFTRLHPAEFQERGIAGTKYEFLGSMPQSLEPNSLFVSRPGEMQGELLLTIESPQGRPIIEVRRV